MAPPDDDIVVLEDETYWPGNEMVVRVRILSVPESEKFEDGIKYRLHYGTANGETIVRYDNSHGVHERHTPDGLDETYEFPGYGAVVDRFFAEVPVDR
jgi:hypothetical protein